MPNNQPADVVAFLVTILTLVTSKEVASLLGPYAAIAVAASAGSAVSLRMATSKKPMLSWWQPITYILARIILAVVITGSSTKIIHAEWVNLDSNALLIFIALGIGLIWSFEGVIRWVISLIKKAAPVWLQNLGGKKDG